MKKILAMTLAALMALSMVACDKKDDDEDEKDSSSVVDTVDKDNSSKEDDGTTESVDIINADLSSGLVQICGDVFKNGGYMTVNEFISEYGDKYDVSSIDTQKEVEEGWSFCYLPTNKASGETIELFCCEPVSGSGVVGDGVVVMIWENNACYPSGIDRINQMDESSIISFYEANGCTFSEVNYDKSKPLYEKFPAAENAGKYAQYKPDDTANIIIAAVELDSKNLYGEIPKILYSYENYNEENNYFKAWEVNYKGSKSVKEN